jgi:2,4-dienoyl-CoA reductase-like NADH-dependent reductase (Old Yellow Enzyme family)
MQATGVVTPIPQGQEVSDEFEYLANIDDSIIPSYQRVADAVHAEGGKFLGQLGVMANTTTMVGKVNWGPSVTMSEVSRLVTHPMTDTEIRRLIKATIDAAHRCIRGGLDGVEILAYAGTLFQQFLSPMTNRRDDDWGGDTERRIRLVQEILSGIRARIA